MSKNKPRIGIMDLENAPHSALVWSTYNIDRIAHLSETGYLLSYAIKELGSKQTKVKALCDYKGYKSGNDCEEQLAKDLWKDLDSYDIIIGHNMDRFDMKKANAAFYKYGLGKPSPYATVDTLKVSRRNFMLHSNKLDDLLGLRQIGQKLKHEGMGLWVKCMHGDKTAWRKMIKYNRIDVIETEKLYVDMLPWIENHPNVAALSGEDLGLVCNTCLSDNLIKRGLTKPTAAGMRKQRYKCGDCGKWLQGAVVQKALVIRNDK